MNKQEMMKLFTQEVATCMAEGWLLVPDNSSYSNGVINIKLEREGERQTLRIVEQYELAYNVYVVERVNAKGQILDQVNYYYLWEWRRQDEDNHNIVTSVKELIV